MKKSICLVAVFAAFVVLTASPLAGQMGMGGYGHMMPGYGYGMGPGMMGGSADVPGRLPAPKDKTWVQKLSEVLSEEKLSLAQYTADQKKFKAFIPYIMVIPQEEYHVDLITRLFQSYQISNDSKVLKMTDNKTLDEAYQNCVRLEKELLPRYEWLVKNAEDTNSAQVLNLILLQSRYHLVMFEHALTMGNGGGYGRGMGMMRGRYYGMGPGMMGGKGQWFNGRPPAGSKPLDMKQAEDFLKDYLKASRNPNLKAGPLKDSGDNFEADILTKNNDLVDKVLINKLTGFIRSVY